MNKKAVKYPGPMKLNKHLLIQWHRLVGWWIAMDKRHGVRWRVANGAAAALMLISATLPLAQQLLDRNLYDLNPETKSLIGKSDNSLSKLLTFDAKKQQYQFNKDAVDEGNLPPELMKKTVGAPSTKESLTYALDVPIDMKQGVTYHDTSMQVSFSMVPQFQSMTGKQVGGRLVYPLNGGTQAVYTLKNNGLKEDIVVPKATDDTMRFSYDLKLPKSLEIKAIPDSHGAVGIYSADPALFGDMTYGSDADRANVEKARENAEKTYLVFGLPAPVIKAPEGQSIGNASAHFELNDNTLAVVAEGLQDVHFPISIDPSVVVTSTADFYNDGNDEGMIDFSVNGQITRGGLTGGSVGSWTTSANTYTGTREKAAAIAYDGYLYILGGVQRSPQVSYDTVQYAPLNASNGSVGTWVSTTNLPAVYGDLTDNVGVYNGYLYLIGGSQVSPTNQTWYIHINSTGGLDTTWTAGTTLWQTLAGNGTVAYNGYMYTLGGTDGFPGQCNTACLNTARYASLNADGSLGAWVPTTNFSTGRYYGRAVAHDGYIYIMGGAGSGGFLNSVEYAAINADGTLGAWQTTTGFTGARYGHTAYMYRGYMYVMGGWTGASNYMNDVQYAQVNANGSLGSWTTTTAFLNGRNYSAGASWNGYLYEMSGYNPASTPVDYNDTQYVKVNPPGEVVSWANAGPTLGTARALSCAVAYNGYIYNVGGSTNDSTVNNVVNVDLAKINVSTGALPGTWTAGRAFPDQRGSEGCAAANGYIYVWGGYVGGGTSTPSLYYASLNQATGAIGTWTSGTALPSNAIAPGGFTHVAADGTIYLYSIGGYQSGGNINTQTGVYYAPLDANTGAVGAWTKSTNSLTLNYGSRQYGMVGKYLYAWGGTNGSSQAVTATEYAVINDDGSTGAWATTGSLATAITWGYGTAVNGCLYQVNGENSAGTSLNTVQYACPAANGTISSWKTTTNLSTATTDGGAVGYGGYIYLIGGFRAAITGVSLFAAVNNGGSGGMSAWSTSATSFTTGRDYTGVVSYKNYLYIVGGDDGGSGLHDVQYAQIGSDGTVGAWANANTGASYPTARKNHAVVIYNGYMYVIGGYDGTDQLADVNYAHINANGTIGTWATTTNLTVKRDGHAVVAYGGYMYVIGGWSTSVLATVQSAPIDPNSGTLGSWTNKTSLPAGREYHRAVVTNGYIYVVGGDNNVSNYNDILSVQITSPGTLGNWNTVSDYIGTPRNTSTVVVYDGYMYLIGGYDFSTAYADVQYAPITANGTLGSWVPLTALANGHGGGGGAAINGRLYILGGYNGTSLTTTTRYTSLNIIARDARYSKVIDLGSVMNVSGIRYGGSLPGGLDAISYRAAGVNGVFGTRDISGTITALSACTTNVQSARYILISIVLDDSATGILSDATSTPSYLSDLSITYLRGHPAPNIRMHLGKTLLEDEGLSPLDTCNG